MVGWYVGPSEDGVVDVIACPTNSSGNRDGVARMPGVLLNAGLAAMIPGAPGGVGRPAQCGQVGDAGWLPAPAACTVDRHEGAHRGRPGVLACLPRRVAGAPEDDRRFLPGQAGARHVYPFDSKKVTNGSQQAGVTQPPWMKTMV